MLKRTLLSIILIAQLFNLFAQPQVIDQVLAVVGNNIILKSDVENQYLQMIAQGADSYGDIKCEIFEDLLFQKLLLNQAKVDSIEVTESEVEQRLEARLAMIINQAGSQEALVEYFNKPMDEIKSDLRKLLREQLLTQKMQSKITENIKITPSEVRNYFKSLDKDSLPLINSQLEIAQITREPKIYPEQIDAIKEKLNKYIERVNNGDKFSTLAILYSQDPGSAKNGGELGYITRHDLVSEFAAVAFNLKEPNEISGIVETDFGYHIIQLIDRKGERINVRHILLTPKVSRLEKKKVLAVLDSIADVVRKDSLTFAKAAIKFSNDEETKINGGVLINPATGNSHFQADEIDYSTYYAIKDLKISEISEPVESVDRKRKTIYKIITVITRTDPHVANINTDYQYLQNLALSEKKVTAVDKWIDNKQKDTYIRIDDSYKNCKFINKGWIK